MGDKRAGNHRHKRFKLKSKQVSIAKKFFQHIDSFKKFRLSFDELAAKADTLFYQGLSPEDEDTQFGWFLYFIALAYYDMREGHSSRVKNILDDIDIFYIQFKEQFSIKEVPTKIKKDNYLLRKKIMEVISQFDSGKDPDYLLSQLKREVYRNKPE